MINKGASSPRFRWFEEIGIEDVPLVGGFTLPKLIQWFERRSTQRGPRLVVRTAREPFRFDSYLLV